MKFLLAVVVAVFVAASVGCKKKCGTQEGDCYTVAEQCIALTSACSETCKTPELTDRSVCYLNCAKVYQTCWGD